MKLNTLTNAVVGMGVLSTAALGGDTILQTFDLFDHPSGAVAPQAYGLRLDSVGPDDPMTFSFGNSQANSTMTMQVVQLDAGGVEIRMFGTVTGNSATGGTSLGTFTIDATYSVSGDVNNGWEDGGSAATGPAFGTITGDFDNDTNTADTTVDLFGALSGGDTFRFLSDGHRISGDNSTWVGRGWVEPNGLAGNTNDWLFQGALVPLPPAAWAGLAMLGGIAAARRFRK